MVGNDNTPEDKVIVGKEIKSEETVEVDIPSAPEAAVAKINHRTEKQIQPAIDQLAGDEFDKV